MLRHENQHSTRLSKTSSSPSISLVQVLFFNYLLLCLPSISTSNPQNNRVFIDDKDLQGSGGDGYENYGIDNKTGAMVVVRPDGYVGMISPLDKISDIRVYFGSFAISRDS